MKGAHDISTCKSVVKRTQEDDEVLCLLSVLTPIHTLTTVNAATCSLLQLSYSNSSLARSRCSHICWNTVFSSWGARCRMFSRPVEVVRLALVGGFPRKKNSTALRMTYLRRSPLYPADPMGTPEC